jgi:predicted ATPase
MSQEPADYNQSQQLSVISLKVPRGVMLMAVQQLDVHGYRSFRDTRWKPGKLNLVVGPNGSGKSNLLRLLELIAETAKGRLVNAMKQGGGIIPLLWDYRAPALDWTIRIDPVDAGRDPVRDALTLEFRLEHLRNTSSYQIAVDSLGSWQLVQV